MSAVPTYKIRNVKTGETRVVNQSSYHSDYRFGGSRFLSTYFGGDWEIVSENHRGGDDGFGKAKLNLDSIVAVDQMRESNPLRPQ